ncbi:uncharacterized protein V1518DRAFT_406432 [Limtongia smithiae]|uniref:uncharacterized protein n=1 Tax=Limtongia smithiae TaxID=1125753 RepID=UPI0034CFFCA6
MVRFAYDDSFLSPRCDSSRQDSSSRVSPPRGSPSCESPSCTQAIAETHSLRDISMIDASPYKSSPVSPMRAVNFGHATVNVSVLGDLNANTLETRSIDPFANMPLLHAPWSCAPSPLKSQADPAPVANLAGINALVAAIEAQHAQSISAIESAEQPTSAIRSVEQLTSVMTSVEQPTAVIGPVENRSTFPPREESLNDADDEFEDKWAQMKIGKSNFSTESIPIDPALRIDSDLEGPAPQVYAAETSSPPTSPIQPSRRSVKEADNRLDRLNDLKSMFNIRHQPKKRSNLNWSRSAYGVSSDMSSPDVGKAAARSSAKMSPFARSPAFTAASGISPVVASSPLSALSSTATVRAVASQVELEDASAFVPADTSTMKADDRVTVESADDSLALDFSISDISVLRDLPDPIDASTPQRTPAKASVVHASPLRDFIEDDISEMDINILNDMEEAARAQEHIWQNDSSAGSSMTIPRSRITSPRRSPTRAHSLSPLRMSFTPGCHDDSDISCATPSFHDSYFPQEWELISSGHQSSASTSPGQNLNNATEVLRSGVATVITGVSASNVPADSRMEGSANNDELEVPAIKTVDRDIVVEITKEVMERSACIDAAVSHSVDGSSTCKPPSDQTSKVIKLLTAIHDTSQELNTAPIATATDAAESTDLVQPVNISGPEDDTEVDMDISVDEIIDVKDIIDESYASTNNIVVPEQKAMDVESDICMTATVETAVVTPVTDDRSSLVAQAIKPSMDDHIDNTSKPETLPATTFDTIISTTIARATAEATTVDGAVVAESLYIDEVRGESTREKRSTLASANCSQIETAAEVKSSETVHGKATEATAVSPAVQIAPLDSQIETAAEVQSNEHADVLPEVAAAATVLDGNVQAKDVSEYDYANMLPSEISLDRWAAANKRVTRSAAKTAATPASKSTGHSSEEIFTASAIPSRTVNPRAGGKTSRAKRAQPVSPIVVRSSLRSATAARRREKSVEPNATTETAPRTTGGRVKDTANTPNEREIKTPKRRIPTAAKTAGEPLQTVVKTAKDCVGRTPKISGTAKRTTRSSVADSPLTALASKNRRTNSGYHENKVVPNYRYVNTERPESPTLETRKRRAEEEEENQSPLQRSRIVSIMSPRSETKVEKTVNAQAKLARESKARCGTARSDKSAESKSGAATKESATKTIMKETMAKNKIREVKTGEIKPVLKKRKFEQDDNGNLTSREVLPRAAKRVIRVRHTVYAGEEVDDKRYVREVEPDF